jgi:DNA-binding GntR family transcriptional regulator
MQTDGKCHGTLRLQVYEQLREGILLGKYPKGTALTEIKMSEELGVSRTPVREAFCQLELDGLVAATPNKGVVVEGYDQTDMLDMFEVRSRMESLAAARAASVMPDSDIRKLRSVFEQESELAQTGDFNGLQKSDAAFHDLIFRGSGSKVYKIFYLLLIFIHGRPDTYRWLRWAEANRLSRSTRVFLWRLRPETYPRLREVCRSI